MTLAEIVLVAVAAAHYNNNLERALMIFGETHYIPKSRLLSVSRFNRRLRHYADCLDFYLQTLI